MASLKEIRAKVTSIKSTQKITRAMQMVAASKMRRAQERMELGRPYAKSIYRIILNVMRAKASDYQHPYMIERPVKRVGFIVITSDRGLAGGLNINLFKKLVQSVAQYQEQSVDVQFTVIGSKGLSFLKSVGGEIKEFKKDYGDNPSYEEIQHPINRMLKAYNPSKEDIEAGIEQVDRVYVVFNKFINAMAQQPMVAQLLPLPEGTLDIDGEEAHDESYAWDYIYEPSPEELFDHLMNNYVETIVHQAVLENIASEQSARMVAMKAATDNAGNLIKELQLVYNKLRQAAITQEISEIVGGAAAVS